MPAQAAAHKSILVDVSAHSGAGWIRILECWQAQGALCGGQWGDPAVARISGIGKDGPNPAQWMLDVKARDVTLRSGEEAGTPGDVVIVRCFKVIFTKPVAQR